MLRKLGALVIVVGLCLPHGPDMRPVAVLWASWADLATRVFVGVPVLAALAYALHAFVPPLARLHEQHGPALHSVFRAVFFTLAGGYLHQGLTGERDAWPFWLAALLLPARCSIGSNSAGRRPRGCPCCCS